MNADDAVLRIRTLGGLDISLNGEPLPALASRKADALLVYLARSPGQHSRELLATLLWDDRETSRALSNLSVLLSSLRKHLPEWIKSDRSSVGLDGARPLWIDAAELEARAETARQADESPGGLDPEEAERLDQAVRLYRGDFLAGIHLRGSRGFDEWATVERERLYHAAFQSLNRLADFALHAGDYEAGLRYAARQIELDPYREETYRQMMMMQVRNGYRSEALATYARCKEKLENELGVEPNPETTALAEKIRSAGSQAPGIPAQRSPFIGRAAELTEIAARIANPDCRLLTLTGPGGMGKTRLAIETARRLQNTYINGTYFVAFDSDDKPELVATGIASALDFTFFGQKNPQEQLIQYLQERECLLVLDNFEHLVSAGPFLEEIIQQAPNVILLVTSRERLNLQSEWLLDIEGLPTQTRMGETHSEAAQFFAQFAARVQPDFSLKNQNAALVEQISARVFGVPLGLELAASWIRSLPLEDILAEIEHGLGFLGTTLKNIPERHRSLRAVFDHSWTMLTEDEQHVFRSLSVFRGGFNRESAAAVCGAGIQTLSSLVDKSLIQRSADRYRVHALLRQFAHEKLAADSQASAEMAGAHSRHFGEFLRSREEDMRGPEQLAVVRELEREIDNIRQGWDWAVGAGDMAVLASYLEGLYLFYSSQTRTLEGARVFGEAAAAFRSEESESDARYARLLNRQGKCLELLGESDRANEVYRLSLEIARRIGAEPETALSLQGQGYVGIMQSQYEFAREKLEEALEIFRRIDDPVGISNALNTLCQVARRQGNYAAGREYGQEALALRRARGDLRAISSTLNNLAMVALAENEYQEAQELLEESLALSRQLGYRVGVANVLGNLAHAVYFLGEEQASVRYTQESLEIYREIGDRWGESIASNNLGYIAARAGDFEAARARYEYSLALNRRIGYQWGVANNLDNLGQAVMALGEHEHAEALLTEAIEKAVEVGAPKLLIESSISMGILLIKTGRASEGLTLLGFARAHPALRHPETERAAEAIVNGAVGLSKKAAEAALNTGAAWLESGVNAGERILACVHAI